MLCPKCGIEAGITSSVFVTENDDTPDKETKLFLVQKLSCRNPKCEDYEKVIEEVKNPIELGE